MGAMILSTQVCQLTQCMLFVAENARVGTLCNTTTRHSMLYGIYFLFLFSVFFLNSTYVLRSYNTATRDLPDIYAQARGPQARGRRQITSSRVISDICHVTLHGTMECAQRNVGDLFYRKA